MRLAQSWKSLVVVVASAVCLMATSLSAQGIGGVPSPQGLEVGLSSQSFRGAIRYEDGHIQRNMSWGRHAAFARAALTERLSLSGSANVWHDGRSDRFPNRDYWDITAGLGVDADAVGRGPTRLRLSARYHEAFYVDVSPDRHDKRTGQLSATAAVIHSLGVRRAKVELWAGPTYIDTWLGQYPRAGTSTGHATEKLGGLVGTSILVGRLRAYGELTHLEYWQAHGGVALVVFRGRKHGG